MKITKGSLLNLYLLFAILTIATFSFLPSLLAEENKIDLNSLMQETQAKSDKPGEMTFVWWLPEQYWQGSLEQSPTMTPEQKEAFVAVFRPYTLIAVVDGNVNEFGMPNYKPEADIRASMRIKDSQGVEYAPFDETGINPDTKNILAMMKPVLTNMLGPMGQNMHFFLFPAKAKNGNDISDATKEGGFSVLLGEREFKWELPLNSLLTLKICPTCKAKLSGAYKYCPWDGTRL